MFIDNNGNIIPLDRIDVNDLIKVSTFNSVAEIQDEARRPNTQPGGGSQQVVVLDPTTGNFVSADVKSNIGRGRLISGIGGKVRVDNQGNPIPVTEMMQGYDAGRPVFPVAPGFSSDPLSFLRQQVTPSRENLFYTPPPNIPNWWQTPVSQEMPPVAPSVTPTRQPFTGPFSPLGPLQDLALQQPAMSFLLPEYLQDQYEFPVSPHIMGGGGTGRGRDWPGTGAPLPTVDTGMPELSSYDLVM